MFGYITVHPKELSPAAKDRYQAYYCGLCRTLRTRYGVTGQLALSYDMTFLALLLSALYEPQTRFTTGRCAPHPVLARPRADNEFVAYAADMTAALAYYNFLDNWQDDHSHTSRWMAGRLEPYLADIRARWPRQCDSIDRELDALHALEAAGSDDLDALCGHFGALLGTVFAPREDLWGETLYHMGRALGGFIYLMDAYDDLEKDRRRGSFNALAASREALSPARWEEHCQALLTQQMALCAAQFKLLPILKDSPEGELLYSTLYAGVWRQYNLRQALRTRRGKRTEGDDAQ